MREALELLGDDRLDPDVAAINCEIGRALLFTGPPGGGGRGDRPRPRGRRGARATGADLPGDGSQGDPPRVPGPLRGSAGAARRRGRDRRAPPGARGATSRSATPPCSGSPRTSRERPRPARRPWQPPGERGDRAGESIAICNLMTAKLSRASGIRAAALGERALAEDPTAPTSSTSNSSSGCSRVTAASSTAARLNLERHGGARGRADVEARHASPRSTACWRCRGSDPERGLELLARTDPRGLREPGRLQRERSDRLARGGRRGAGARASRRGARPHRPAGAERPRAWSRRCCAPSSSGRAGCSPPPRGSSTGPRSCSPTPSKR